MRLCLIVNCWGDWIFLEHTLAVMKPLVDGVIIVGSEMSNFGERSQIPLKWYTDDLHIREPQFQQPLHSETDKRNFGLSIAKQQGYSHFLTSDADEVYNPIAFLKMRDRFLNEDLNGIVCPTRVYFGKPNLTIGFDGTLIPFIHKLTSRTQHEFNKLYPYAWDKKRIRIDPSRSLNINSGVEYTEEIVCEHFSWCRGDYEKKIRNSTASANLKRSSILEDLENAKPGYFCKFYQKTLIECENKFNIPEF